MSYTSFKLPKDRLIFSLSIVLAHIRAVVCNDVTCLERVNLFLFYYNQKCFYASSIW